MKDFHRSFICRSTETGKKGHRNKHQSNKTEVCKCYAPFLKLHYYDCPVARKPCPIHGSPYRQCAKDEKTEKKEKMIISFHPSSKTDKLFRPVKNLLAHCNPETKINLEYYSSNNSATKDNMKHRQVQTNLEEIKSSLASSVFVEKTKSFVTDKTNKMKRLKQCFHSPCNSIVARAKSEVAIKNKMSENYREVPKHVAVGANVPKESPDVYLYEKSKWTSSNKLDSSDWEKSSDDKIESDFLTLTQQVENKFIDHKIFEIKHKKGVGDIRFTKLPKQSPFVYSSYDIKKPKNVSTDLGVQAEPPQNQKNLENYSKDNKLVKKSMVKKEDISSSEKSQSSTSGSVYFTPLLLIPQGVEDDTSDESKYADDMPKERPKNLDDKIKPGDKRADTVDRSVQTEAPALGKKIYDTSSTSDNSILMKSSESDKEPVSLKHEKGVGSGNISSSDKFTIYTPEETASRTSKTSLKKNSDSMVDVSQITSKSINKSPQMIPPNSRATDDYDLYDEFYGKKEKTKRDTISDLRETVKSLDDKASKSAKVQTDEVQKREVSLVYDKIKNVADKITQTVPVVTRNVQVETVAAKKNKSQMTYCTMAKSVQTSFTLSDSQSQEAENSESNVNSEAPSYATPDTSRDVNKSPWKKSHSDGDLYNEPKDDSTKENLLSIHHICLCENSETSNSESDYNGYGKISKPEKDVFEKNNSKPVNQSQNEQRPNPIKKDVMSKGEQTSLSDLSELARMVDQFFYKMSKEAFKSCECDKIKKPETKVSHGIQADSSKSVRKPKTDMVDAEVQTIFKVKADLSSEEDKTKKSSKICQSVNRQNDNNETIFVCEICRKKVSTVVAQTSTSNSLEKLQTAKKEVTFISVGTSTDGLEVAKRTIGVCVSDYGPVSYFVRGEQLYVNEGVSTSDLHNVPATKNSMRETQSFFMAKPNNQNAKEWSISITNMKCPVAFDKSASKQETKVDPKKTPVKKEPTVINETREKKVVKKPENIDNWKSTNYSLLSEMYERRTITKPFKPKPGPENSAGGPRRSINFKDREPEVSSLNTQVIFTQGTNKQSFKSQKDPSAPTVSFNRHTVCICDNIDNSGSKLPKPKSKTEPSTSNKIPKTYDQKPPLPTKQQPGGSNSKPNRSAPMQSSPRKPSDKKKTIILPAIIRPMWYKDFRKTLQMIKSCQGLHESKSTILKQKRFWEEDDDLPGGKKIKGRNDGSGESCELEQSFFTSNGEQTVDMRSGTGFVCLPSSALQIPKAETHSKYFLKGAQSESKVPRACLQNSSLFKGINKRAANVLSVRSCRLKPVQVNEKHPFRKLFECRLCKSLNFLKTNQKDTLQTEQRSEGSFGYESSKAENFIPDDENSEPTNWEFSPEIEEEFLMEYSFSSNSSGSADPSENSDFVDDDREVKIERVESSFLSPLDAQADSFSGVAYGSKSFDTFWFGTGSRKK